MKDNKSGEIVINVSEKEVADNAKLEISLDKDFIDSIVKDTDAKLTIKTPEGDKTFTQEELKKLSESAAADGTITVDPTASEPTDITKAEKITKGIDREIKSYGTLKQSGEKECQSNPEAE